MPCTPSLQRNFESSRGDLRVFFAMVLFFDHFFTEGPHAGGLYVVVVGLVISPCSSSCSRWRKKAEQSISVIHRPGPKVPCESLQHCEPG